MCNMKCRHCSKFPLLHRAIKCPNGHRKRHISTSLYLQGFFLWFCVSINLGSGSLLDGAGCPPECLANVRGLINIKLSEEERGTQLHLPLDARTHIDTDWWPGCLPCGCAVVAIEVSNATWRQCKLTLVPYLHRRNTCCFDVNLSCFVSISFVLPICLLFLCITVH